MESLALLPFQGQKFVRSSVFGKKIHSLVIKKHIGEQIIGILSMSTI